jgi:YesN/AraC family two-component response regulator
MGSQLYERTLEYAKHLESICEIATAIFDFSVHDFSSDTDCSFCQNCEQFRLHKCEYRIAHRYSCFEAERWNGLYVYYCPLSLVFVSTVIFERKTAAYAIVTGPAVMGAVEDVLGDSLMNQEILDLPLRSPGKINDLLKVQGAMSMYLSQRESEASVDLTRSQAVLHNTLYELTERSRKGQDTHYPVEIEHTLQQMITHGDKKGAQELINELLGSLYFSSYRDFPQIRERAKELVVLFSRASIDGGADMQQIFGQNRNFFDEIDESKTLYELSALLTSVFHRFVGYVFDFSQFEHSDILHKVIVYLRENLSEKLAVEDVAAHVGLSRGYLSTLFKSELGVGFPQYINDLRIDKSKTLLMNSNISLAEIADLVGYGDQSYYTKKFLQATGVTPKQYRKKRNHSDIGE